MRNTTRLAVVGFSLLLPACAIHPLPEDVTGDTTYHIVQKIRCEARDALTKLAIRGLRESQNPRTQDLAQKLAAGEVDVIQIFKDPKLSRDVDPDVHQNFDIMALSAIGFDFTLTGTENNDTRAAANFRYPLWDGVFNLGVSAGNTRERQNERKLRVGHTFIELYDQTRKEVCDRIAAGTGNLIYPITGKIGLEELINTFYLLNRPYNENLYLPVERHGPVDVAYKNLVSKNLADVGKLTDTLMFTTTLSAGATPSITLNPIPARAFRLADANLELIAKRTDVHKVAISVEKGPRVSSIAQALTLAGLRASELSRQVAKDRTFQRLDDLRTEDFFTRQREISRRLGFPPL
jgi:hypothetical protein